MRYYLILFSITASLHLSCTRDAVDENKPTKVDQFISTLPRNYSFINIDPEDTVLTFFYFADTFYFDGTVQYGVISKRGFFSRNTFCFNIEHTVFRRPLTFRYSKFGCGESRSYCDFYYTQFDSSVLFESNSYDTSIEFSNCRFKNGLQIVDQFDVEDAPRFFGCEFKGNVTFNRSLGGNSKLSSSFRSPLVFGNCKFEGTLDISSSFFRDEGTVYLFQTILPDSIDISNSQLSAPIDLTVAYPNPRGKCRINLLGVDIKKLKLQYHYFKLYFPDTVLNNPLGKDRVSSTYEALLGNFKENGFNDSYRKLDTEYRIWQSKSNWLLHIDYFWWRFGYEKWMILFWTLLFIAVFSIWNYVCYARFQAVYTVDSLQWKRIPHSSNTFVRFLKKYFATLLYTGFIFFRLGIDFNKLNFTSTRYISFVILQYAVGLVCTGFLINWIISRS